VPKFQGGILIRVDIMGYQVHAIGNAIRPLFTDPVTNFEIIVYSYLNHHLLDTKPKV